MKEKPDSIKILMATTNVFLQTGINSYVSDEDSIEILDQPSNGLELMECIHNTDADVVVLTEDDSSGTRNDEIIQLIHQKAKDIKILMIIKHYDEDRELYGLKMGVRGFLSENARSADFIKCVKALSRGEM